MFAISFPSNANKLFGEPELIGKGQQRERERPFDLYAICINNGLPLLGSYKVVVVVVAVHILSILLHSGCRFFRRLGNEKKELEKNIKLIIPLDRISTSIGDSENQ
jgi:hypothetical protein